MSNLDALFCPKGYRFAYDVDDFCNNFEPQWKTRLLQHGGIKRDRAKSLCLSEIMTILMAFHQNHYRNFQHFYLDHVKQYWHSAFPGQLFPHNRVKCIYRYILPSTGHGLSLELSS